MQYIMLLYDIEENNYNNINPFSLFWKWFKRFGWGS